MLRGARSQALSAADRDALFVRWPASRTAVTRAAPGLDATPAGRTLRVWNDRALSERGASCRLLERHEATLTADGRLVFRDPVVLGEGEREGVPCADPLPSPIVIGLNASAWSTSMGEQLKGASNTWEIAARTDTMVDGGDGPSAGRSRHFKGFDDAHALLLSLDADPLNARALRAAMAAVDPVRDLSLLDADEAHRLAAWMLDGRSLLERRHRSEFLGGGGGDDPDGPDEPVDPVPAPTETWIEVHLKRVDGTPVSGERYSVKLPDGTVQEGTTNAAGSARIEHIEPAGICDWSFPDLDRRMATRAGP